MVTSRLISIPVLLLSAAACSGAITTTPAEERNGAGGAASTGTGGVDVGSSSSGASTNAYPGKGFIVHEWGTDTIVVGSDGTLQRGLHHEEEDLPSFVYDRLKAGSLAGPPSVEVKMETPVTYFYSDTPLSTKVSVGFPKGVFTQWYPATHSFAPAIVGPNAKLNVKTFLDPVLDPSFPFDSPTCASTYATIGDGHLDWGSVDVLARGAEIASPEAPLDEFTWSYARAVDANPIRIASAPGVVGSEAERFLFYRGLGRFDLPLHVTAKMGGAFSLANAIGEKVGSVFALDVGADRAAFTVLGDVAGSGTLEGKAPSLDGAPPIESFVDSLATEMTKSLETTGLYHDEAVAMVSTWKRQWFRTPGIRLLYLVPQSWTDASIPLTIDPKPASTTRVMMIRVEVITPELENEDVAAAQGLASSATAEVAKAHFVALGRFAEPRLRRALSIMGDPAYAAPFLASIATADTTNASGE